MVKVLNRVKADWTPPEPKKPWYAPGELHCLRSANYRKGETVLSGVSGPDPREQVLFVLAHLEDEKWPREPSVFIGDGTGLDTNGVPINVQKSRSQRMPNQTWIEVVAELRRRIDMTGDDGNVVYLVHEYGVDIDTTAMALQTSFSDINKRYWRVINYVSTGRFEDRPPYRLWCEKKSSNARKAITTRWQKQ